MLPVEKKDEVVDVLKWNGYAVQAKMLADNIAIEGEESERQAVDSLKIIKDFYIEAEEARREKVAPFNDMVKRINMAFKSITDTLEQAEAALKEKLLAWHERKESLRQQFEQRQQDEYEAALHNSSSGNVPIPPVVLPSRPTMTGSIGQASQRTIWRWRVIDKYKVPAEYLTVDEKLINEKVRSGVREIEGIEIYPEKILSIK